MNIAPQRHRRTWLAVLAALYAMGWCVGRKHAANSSVVRTESARPSSDRPTVATSSAARGVAPEPSVQASMPIEVLPASNQNSVVDGGSSVSTFRKPVRASGPSTRLLPNVIPNPPNVSARLDRALELLAHGSIAQACAEAKLAAELTPNSPQVWEFLGQCNMRLGRPELARTYYRRFLELAPSNGRAQFIRAILDTTG